MWCSLCQWMYYMKLLSWIPRSCWESVYCCCCSISHVWLFATPCTEHAKLPCPSLSPRVCSDSWTLSQWCHPTISSSVIPLSCLQTFPASGSFPMSQLFSSSGYNIGASASSSILPMKIQDWFPLGLTGWNSFLSNGLSRVFSSTQFDLGI